MYNLDSEYFRVYIYSHSKTETNWDGSHIFGGETVCRFAVRRRLYADNTTQHLTRAITANTVSRTKFLHADEHIMCYTHTYIR